MKRLSAALSVAGLSALLAACQSPAVTPSAPVSGGSKSAALRNMEQVATAAYRCWFSCNDPEFRGYSFANELNSFTGRPRFLLVPKGNYGGRPLLVFQAEGYAGAVTSFGPMTSGPSGARVSADLNRWSSGNTACSGNA
ncbi:MAG TPA: hypothetical protein VLZ56_02405 [Mycoplana sp.]|nr:hypothetical protein [Mycoplana sp.]